ncbi:hypothetical protein pb186bvf_010146 [Paramecium bursaria]
MMKIKQEKQRNQIGHKQSKMTTLQFIYEKYSITQLSAMILEVGNKSEKLIFKRIIVCKQESGVTSISLVERKIVKILLKKIQQLTLNFALYDIIYLKSNIQISVYSFMFQIQELQKIN